MKRKLLIVAAVLAALALVFAGCKNNGSKDEANEITITDLDGKTGVVSLKVKGSLEASAIAQADAVISSNSALFVLKSGGSDWTAKGDFFIELTHSGVVYLFTDGKKADEISSLSDIPKFAVTGSDKISFVKFLDESLLGDIIPEPGDEPNLPAVMETEVLYDAVAGSPLHFMIAQSGDRAWSNNDTKVDLNYDLITPGGYIEAVYSGTQPPVLGFYALDRLSGQEIALVEGSDIAPGIRRYQSDDILDAIEKTFGWEDVGSRSPNAAFQAGFRISRTEQDGATTITKFSINYNKNHRMVRPYDTLLEMQKAANTHSGDTTRIKAALAKAQLGQPITVVFLGGSITEAGSGKAGYVLYNPGDNIADDGYSNKVVRWLRNTFPNSAITYLNHGVGGTPSSGGKAWLDNFTGDGTGSGGLLAGADGAAATRIHNPDIVFLEFAVNDSMSGWSGGEQGPHMDYMIDRILDESNAAVVVLTSLDFYSGVSADAIHSLVAAKYDVPVVNHRAALWPNLYSKKAVPVHGDINAADVSHGQQSIQINTQGLAYDAVHPTNLGHSAYADFITYFLNEIKKSL